MSVLAFGIRRLAYEISGYVLSIISYIPLRMNQNGTVQKNHS